MTAFVGGKKPVSVPELLKLIDKLAIEPSYYFLRWNHQVSENWETAPEEEKDFPMLEGQMFNQECELRWKRKRNNNYEVLLLSIAGEHSDFIKIGEEWQIQQREAHFHSPEDRRFPKSLPAKQTNIAQRYFIDKKTATVHFVALTIKK
ncbi:MAG TPA: hypothetical protein VE956_08880 [Nodularia sp. (in: cyanobacteria)]|nr:hypothetical protein [Nodularia sp. (in: cyanobacteria)]